MAPARRPLLWPLVAFAGLIGRRACCTGCSSMAATSPSAMWELRPLLYSVAMYVLASNLFTAHVALCEPRLGGRCSRSRCRTSSRSHYYYALSLGDAVSARGPHRAPDLAALHAGLPPDLGGLRAARLLACGRGSCWFWPPSRPPRCSCCPNDGPPLLPSLPASSSSPSCCSSADRKAFFVLVPIVLLLTAGYTAAFWNCHRRGGLSGRVRSRRCSRRTRCPSATLPPTSIGQIENFDLVYTIRAEPSDGRRVRQALLPAGPAARHQLLRLLPVHPAQLGPLDLAEDGVLSGFVTLLFIIAAAIRAGIRASLRCAIRRRAGGHRRRARVHRDVLRVRVRRHRLGAKTCLFLAVCMATCANMVRLAPARGRTTTPGRAARVTSRPASHADRAGVGRELHCCASCPTERGSPACRPDVALLGGLSARGAVICRVGAGRSPAGVRRRAMVCAPRSRPRSAPTSATDRPRRPRQPVWPDGVTGSISHAAGLAAAVAAPIVSARSVDRAGHRARAARRRPLAARADRRRSGHRVSGLTTRRPLRRRLQREGGGVQGALPAAGRGDRLPRRRDATLGQGRVEHPPCWCLRRRSVRAGGRSC